MDVEKQSSESTHLLMFSVRMYSTRSMIAELMRLSFGWFAAKSAKMGARWSFFTRWRFKKSSFTPTHARTKRSAASFRNLSG